MGAWGCGVFDNGNALDWMAKLQSSDDLQALVKAIETVINTADYLEAAEGAILLGACEVLAALNGKAPTALPDEVCRWIIAHDALDSSSLVPRALLALDRVVGENSELCQLWQENENDFPVWYETVPSIKSHLQTFAYFAHIG